MDTDYGIDWAGPHRPHQQGIIIPEVQLPRPLTEEEVERLPNPEASFSSVLDIYIHAVALLQEMMNS